MVRGLTGVMTVDNSHAPGRRIVSNAPGIGVSDANAETAYAAPMLPHRCNMNAGLYQKLALAFRALIAMAAASVLLAACGGVSEPSTSVVELGPGIRLISGPSLVDTAMARPAEPFVVEVRDSLGGFAPTDVIVGSTATSGADTPYPTAVDVAGSPNDPGAFFAIVPLDTAGRVTFWVRFGRKAGRAQVTVSGLGQKAKLELTILPANPTTIRVLPADTAVYVGKRYTLAATVTDQFGNDRTDPVAFTAGSGLTVTPAGVVTPTEIGRRSTKLTSGKVSGEAWVSVPPLGTLAAISGPTYRESIVVLDLDGSNWRPLAQLSTYSQRTAPQWSPSGQELVFHNSTDQGIKAYRVDLAGNVRRALGPDGPPAQVYPRYSRDGQWLFFSGGTGVRLATTWRARADGSNPVQIGPSVFEPYFHSDPSPSPGWQSRRVRGTAQCDLADPAGDSRPECHNARDHAAGSHRCIRAMVAERRPHRLRR